MQIIFGYRVKRSGFVALLPLKKNSLQNRTNYVGDNIKLLLSKNCSRSVRMHVYDFQQRRRD